MSDGRGCKCGAHGKHECGCGVDWTRQEVYDLREEVKQLRENIAAITFTSMDTSQVTRFEVIDHTATGTGRDFVKYAVGVSLAFQDNNTTLKIFLKDKGNDD